MAGRRRRPGEHRLDLPDPLPAVGAVKDLLAFYNEVVDITVDGEGLERPVTPFTRALAEQTQP